LLEDVSITDTLNTASGLNLSIYLVCNGSGGLDFGDSAGQLYSNVVLSEIKGTQKTEIPEILADAVKIANRQVLEQLRQVGTRAYDQREAPRLTISLDGAALVCGE
jgi:hypothetical protein